ncbi:MAG: DUF1592 domain-containing protein [Opitutales bacterium]|nr:DUF1592 domain-containing protein [Opitutales bacterium]
MRSIIWSCFCLFPGLLFSNVDLPRQALGFFENHCFECHAGDDDFIEGDVNLEMTSVDWSVEGTTDFWSQVYEMVHSSDMPPRDAESFPSLQEREDFLAWLGRDLTKHVPVGGTSPRRLNRVEYENTIRSLFNLPDFEVSASFPADSTAHGFDNVASGLILSPPLLAQYFENATAIVDEVLPPPVVLPKAEPVEYPDAVRPNLGGGSEGGRGVYRLVSSRNRASDATWTAPFEVSVSGIYHVQVKARPFQTGDMFYEPRETPFRLEVYARQNGEERHGPFENLRYLGTFNVPANGKQGSAIELEAELFLGEVVGFRWADGPMRSPPGAHGGLDRAFIDERLLKSRKFYAANLEFQGGPRGTTQAELYETIQALMKSDDLDPSDPRLNTLPEVYRGGFSNGFSTWSIKYGSEEMLRFGPALDILDVSVKGPTRVVPDPLTRKRLARSDRFLGERSPELSDMEFAKQFLEQFLTRAFRRPVLADQLDDYVDVVRGHRQDFPEKRVEDALHLAIRRALVSPHFLYRGLRPGVLDDWDLASRLSYFLSSGPPDAELLDLASQGELSNSEVLEKEVHRLLAKPERKEFIRHFTGQWLGTRVLKDIMPDPRLLKFINQDRDAMIAETEMFFEEILLENHSLDAFIDPGFSYRNDRLNKIYGGDLKDRTMERVTFPKGSAQGGLLGLASIMMATANGVDTHPVHRGVWLLENVLGQPTPPPPPDVPAVAPDTTGTTTMREQMVAHLADQACARCHQKIDPLGFVMENFDPVGRWREYYPVYTIGASVELDEEYYSNQGKGTRKGPLIDTAAAMPDGTELETVTDLKAYLLENGDLFAECLTEKLLVYGTGREPSFGDRRVIRQMVNDHSQRESGFTDLMVALVLSESFRTR